jgi:predicted HTH domain antitoxin
MIWHAGKGSDGRLGFSLVDAGTIGTTSCAKEQTAMVTLQISDELATILDHDEEPIERVALEAIVLELYRRGTISSGKAAELLAVPRYKFIQRASALGIPYFNVTPEELDAEIDLLQSLRR